MCVCMRMHVCGFACVCMDNIIPLDKYMLNMVNIMRENTDPCKNLFFIGYWTDDI